MMLKNKINNAEHVSECRRDWHHPIWNDAFYIFLTVDNNNKSFFFSVQLAFFMLT